MLKKILDSELFELEDIEASFSNGRTKDFLFRQKSNNEKRLIEVLNIHLPVGQMDSEGIKRVLIHRVKTKIDWEIAGVENDEELKSLFILPVVWYLDTEILQKGLYLLFRF